MLLYTLEYKRYLDNKFSILWTRAIILEKLVFIF